jgi:hypothetical protein
MTNDCFLIESYWKWVICCCLVGFNNDELTNASMFVIMRKTMTLNVSSVIGIPFSSRQQIPIEWQSHAKEIWPEHKTDHHDQRPVVLMEGDHGCTAKSLWIMLPPFSPVYFILFWRVTDNNSFINRGCSNRIFVLEIIQHTIRQSSP